MGNRWVYQVKKGEKVNYEWNGEIIITQSWSKILIYPLC